LNCDFTDEIMKFHSRGKINLIVYFIEIHHILLAQTFWHMIVCSEYHLLGFSKMAATPSTVAVAVIKAVTKHFTVKPAQVNIAWRWVTACCKISTQNFPSSRTYARRSIQICIYSINSWYTRDRWKTKAWHVWYSSILK
jgi:hypothetical protein